MSKLKLVSKSAVHIRTKRKFQYLLTFSLAAFSFVCSASPRAWAESLHAVHLHVGAKEYIGNTACLSDGQETYIPLSVLKSVGGTYKISTSGDSLYFKPCGSTKEAELAIARLKGEPMIALSDVARCLQAVVLKPEQKAKDSGGSETLALMARILGVKFQNGELKITTSFPVPYHVHMIADTHPVRGYVDIDGTVLPLDFKPESLPLLEKTVSRVSAAQNSPEISRVVVELAQGSAFKAGEYTKNGSVQIAVQTIKMKSEIAAEIPKVDSVAPISGHFEAKKGEPTPLVSVHPDVKNTEAAGKVVVPVRTQSSGSLDDPAPLIAPTVPGEKALSDHALPTSTAAPKSAQPPSAVKTPDIYRGLKPSRLGKSRHEVLPVDIKELVLHSESDRVMRLDIATSGRATAFMHYSPDSSQLIVDVPNATLHLNSADSMEQITNHPLITGLHAMQAQESPPMARIALDMSRVIGFSVTPFNDHLSVELRLPTNATGALADKLIVIDPGHGGSSSGALGRGDGVVYEKDITLAISLKLRKELEDAGARVVMTRDKDIDVPLYDRPRLANGIGADLFISIHNDSNGRTNSASGTSTYYHLGDPNSRALAACIQKEVFAVSGLPSRGVLSDGIMYQNGFAVLRASKMPAVLCEVAYINNSRDRAALTSTDFQQRVAQAMCEGLRNYVEGRPKAAALPESNGLKTIRTASEPVSAQPLVQIPVSLEK